jgi:hypothetical protein
MLSERPVSATCPAMPEPNGTRKAFALRRVFTIYTRQMSAKVLGAGAGDGCSAGTHQLLRSAVR